MKIPLRLQVILGTLFYGAGQMPVVEIDENEKF